MVMLSVSVSYSTLTAKAAGPHDTLVARTQRWLDNLTVKADLDAWRLEMARRTELLLKSFGTADARSPWGPLWYH